MHVTVESTGHGEPPSTDDEADVSIALASVAVLVATAVSVTVLLLVRRGAPDGSYFNDGDRAAGVFGVLATSFSILLGFIVFLAFTSYDDSRRGAEDEALAVVQQFETAQFLPAATGNRAAGELVCYARSVVYGEWPRMRGRHARRRDQPLGRRAVPDDRRRRPAPATEQAAYSKWLDQTSDREVARTTASTPPTESSRHRSGSSCS